MNIDVLFYSLKANLFTYCKYYRATGTMNTSGTTNTTDTTDTIDYTGITGTECKALRTIQILNRYKHY